MDCGGKGPGVLQLRLRQGLLPGFIPAEATRVVGLLCRQPHTSQSSIKLVNWDG